MKFSRAIAREDLTLYSILTFIIIAAVILNGVFSTFLFFLIPFACLLSYWLIHDLRFIYVLLFAILPFSVEVELPGGLGLDLPTELLMILLTGIGLILLLLNGAKTRAAYVLHPVSLLLTLHLSWILFSSLLSTVPIISLKYSLAKSWYVIPFYCLSIYFLRTKNNYMSTLKFLILSVFIACCYVWFNHAQVGFSFKDINPSVYPIFRNHVNYACLIVMIMPFYVLYTSQYKGAFKVLLYALGLFFIVSVFLSYTRAAMIALVIGGLSFYIIKWKLIQYTLLVTALASLLVIGVLINDNEFMHHAPTYDKTITHQKFDDLIDATAKGEDISTMERAHRWVAGYYMIQDRPVAGFGPGTFYSNYKAYAVNLFKTFVSDNPEKSTVHNYYLLVLIEQGIIGFLIFILLLGYALIRGQYLYHRLEGFNKHLLMAALVCLIMILAINLINDMIESLKVGSFFFLCLGIIVACDVGTLKPNKSGGTETNVI